MLRVRYADVGREKRCWHSDFPGLDRLRVSPMWTAERWAAFERWVTHGPDQLSLLRPVRRAEDDGGGE